MHRTKITPYDIITKPEMPNFLVSCGKYVWWLHMLPQLHCVLHDRGLVPQQDKLGSVETAPTLGSAATAGPCRFDVTLSWGNGV